MKLQIKEEKKGHKNERERWGKVKNPSKSEFGDAGRILYQVQFDLWWRCLKNHSFPELDPFSGNSYSQRSCSDPSKCLVGSKLHSVELVYSQLLLHKHNPVPSEALDHLNHLCIYSKEHLWKRGKSVKEEVRWLKIQPFLLFNLKGGKKKGF